MPTKRIQKSSRPTIYAFIDSQKLNLGIRSLGWVLDFKKFRVYLKDKYRVEKAFLFIGFVPEYKILYSKLHSFGFDLVFKPTTKDRFGKPKGNIDAELVLHAVRIKYDHYDKAVIVSGDGDFYCLYKYLVTQKRLLRILIPNPKSESSLLKPFHRYKSFINYERQKLELQTSKNGRRRT